MGSKKKTDDKQSDKGSGTKAGKGKGKGDSDEQETKLKGAQSINVRHILVGIPAQNETRHVCSRPSRELILFSARSSPKRKKL